MAVSLALFIVLQLTQEKRRQKKLHTRLYFVHMSRKRKGMTKPLTVVFFFDMQTHINNEIWTTGRNKIYNV
jgi:hypothetical protein